MNSEKPTGATLAHIAPDRPTRTSMTDGRETNSCEHTEESSTSLTSSNGVQSPKSSFCCLEPENCNWNTINTLCFVGELGVRCAATCPQNENSYRAYFCGCILQDRIALPFLCGETLCCRPSFIWRRATNLKLASLKLSRAQRRFVHKSGSSRNFVIFAHMPHLLVWMCTGICSSARGVYCWQVH